MRGRGLALLVGLVVSASCANTPSAQDSPLNALDGQPIFVENTGTSTTTVAAVRSQSREDVYRMVNDFLSQVVPANPGLSAAVRDLGVLADCMVNAGYQINNIPPESLTNTPNTLVAPSTMIAPMLSYLAETCSGVPVSQWPNG